MEHGIQNIFPEGSVEPFDVRILRGLARLDVSQTDAVSLCPDFQPIRDQFGAIVHPDLFGKAPPQQQHFQDPDHTLGRQGGIHLDPQGFPVEVTQDIQGAKGSAARQAIAHKVQRPALLGLRRLP